MTTAPTTVLPPLLLVEDDDLVARAFMSLLRRQVRVVRAASLASAREALTSVPRWAGVVVDDGLPDGSGLDLLRSMRERGDATPALVVTGSVERRVVEACDELDADHVIKPDVITDLTLFAERVARQFATRAAWKDAAVRRLRSSLALTEREAEIVELVAEGARGDALAAGLGVSRSTLQTHVGRLLAKFHESSVDGIARVVLAEMTRDEDEGLTR